MVMAAAGLFISEVLCFTVNKYGKMTRLQLKSVLSGFYSEDELVNAKDVLFGDAGKLNLTDLPRYVKRTSKGDKVKLIADDILDLCTFLDEKHQLCNLPTYVAQNVDRIPKVKLEDMELFCAAKKMEDIDVRLNAVESTSANFTTLIDKCDNVLKLLETRQNAVDSAVDCLTAKLDQVCVKPNCNMQPVHKPSTSSTKLDSSASNDNGCDSVEPVEPEKGEWVMVASKNTPRQPRARPAVRVHGAKVVGPVAESVVRGVPRVAVLAAFVGRLHLDTTEEELTKYLAAEGMKGVVCRKLRPRNGQVFRTAAFRVTCSPESQHLFYDERCWPQDVELRDWIYK